MLHVSVCVCVWGNQAATNNLECHRAATSALNSLLYIPMTSRGDLAPWASSPSEGLRRRFWVLRLELTPNLNWVITAQKQMFHIRRLLWSVGLSCRPLTRAKEDPQSSLWHHGVVRQHHQAERRAPQRVIGTSSLPWTHALYSQRRRRRAEEILRDTSPPARAPLRHQQSASHLPTQQDEAASTFLEQPQWDQDKRQINTPQTSL